MSIFKRKKKEEPIDDRTPVEKTFEDKGQELGKKAGVLAQKGINKFHSLKDDLEEKGTLDKVRNATNKAVKKTNEVFEKVETSVSEAFQGKKEEEDKE